MTTIKEYRNLTTNETAPAHRIGEDESGRPLYQRVEGWVPVVDGGTYLCDEDGNWIPSDHDEHGNVPAIDEAFRQYATTDDNPCGGTGYYDEGEELPYRVHFADGACDESFATLAEAVEAASDYADEMDAESAS